MNFAQAIEAVSGCEVEVNNTLNATNPEAQEIFLADSSLIKPPNQLGRLDAEKMRANLARLDEVENALGDSSLSDKECRAIEMAIDANRRDSSFCLACAEYRANPNAQTAAAQRAANEALYGAPDYATYQALLGSQLEKISQRASQQRLSKDERVMYTELMELLQGVKLTPAERYQPKPETVEAFLALMREYLRPVVANLTPNREISVKEMVGKMQATLRLVVEEGSTWDAEYHPERTFASTSQNLHKIQMPGKRASGDRYTYLEALKIKSHEEGVHAMRCIPYEKARFVMLRLGMPGYTDFEEGVAKAAEQAWEAKYEDANPERYIGIGLAWFENDMSFRRVFEIQKRMMSLVSGKDQTKVAFMTTQRTFRGTDVLPNNKDMAYYNGNVKVWRYIERHLDDPELFDQLFLSGKTDITNLEHERLVYEARMGGL